MVQLKEVGEYLYEVISTEFQFLMVQLKDNTRVCSISYYVISIPYGSIKRFIAITSSHLVSDFNSLWFN